MKSQAQRVEAQSHRIIKQSQDQPQVCPALKPRSSLCTASASVKQPSQKAETKPFRQGSLLLFTSSPGNQKAWISESSEGRWRQRPDTLEPRACVLPPKGTQTLCPALCSCPSKLSAPIRTGPLTYKTQALPRAGLRFLQHSKSACFYFSICKHLSV